MKIISVEVVDHEASARLRRDARLARRQRSEYLRTVDPVALLRSDISNILTGNNLDPHFGSFGSPLPAVAGHHVGKYEEHDDIALLYFAREKLLPVLVQFSCEPSRIGTSRLRQEAKSRNLKLRLFRLTSARAIVEVHPRNPAEFDAEVLKSLGVKW